MKSYFVRKLSKFKRLPFHALPMFIGFILSNQAVVVQWLPNTESDLAGYIVHYGTASRAYLYALNAGLATSYTIENLERGREYFFAVTAFDTAGNESQFSREVSIYLSDDGDVINLDGSENFYNFPNPFDPEDEYTQIRYVLRKPESVTLVILDITGKKIRSLLNDVSKQPGEHIEDLWDGRDDKGNFVANGIYYAHLTSESLNQYLTIAVSR